MKISPFTPLFFIDRPEHGQESEYRQTFATTDNIMLQVLCHPEEAPVANIYDACGIKMAMVVRFNVWNMNAGISLHWARFTLPAGIYYIEIAGLGRCETFEVTDDSAKLRDTVLIEYTMKDNRQRTDAVFVTPDEQLVFAFRVHGGFKDADWTFSVDNEQFTDEYSDTFMLYGLESTQKKFTMGQSEGVPVWYGEFLNRLLVCTYVWFDSEQYVRSESNVPEMTQNVEGINSFVFSQTLRKAVGSFGDPADGAVYLRRIDGQEDYRNIESGESRSIKY